AYPLPAVVGELRLAMYPPLAGIANHWNEAMGIAVRYPTTLAEFLDRCHRAGQTKPTPLGLRYGEGDYNCLHQDVYGEHLFPIQATVLLAVPGRDFTGGEFVLAEQRPRMQSRVEVVPLEQGDCVIFPVRHRPVRGSRGSYRVTMRHGVSRLRSGHRHTLGIIFQAPRGGAAARWPRAICSAPFPAAPSSPSHLPRAPRSSGDSPNRRPQRSSRRSTPSSPRRRSATWSRRAATRCRSR